MINMGYCRMENTSMALEECIEALENGEVLSSREASYSETLKTLCEQYIEAHEAYERETDSRLMKTLDIV